MKYLKKLSIPTFIIVYTLSAQETERIDIQGEYGSEEEPPLELAAQEDIDASSGNWYEKLQYFNKAKPQYEQLSQRVTRLQESHKGLLEKLTQIQEERKRFYDTMRINARNINTTLDTLIQQIKPIQDTSPTTEAERAKLIESADKQKALEQTKKDFDLLTQVYTELERAYTQDLTNQIKKAEIYQEKALDSFEQIEKTRSHEKAQTLYNIIENSNENTHIIEQYIKNIELYTNRALAKIQQLIERISADIDYLEKRGLTVRATASDEQFNSEKQKKQIEIEQAQKTEQARKKAELERWNSLSWWRKILEYIISSIWAVIFWIVRIFKRS